MIWFVIVPSVWLAASGILGMLIGRCIASEPSDEPEWVAGEAEVPTATSTDARREVGTESAEGISTIPCADAETSEWGDDEARAQLRDRTYAAVR